MNYKALLIAAALLAAPLAFAEDGQHHGDMPPPPQQQDGQQGDHRGGPLFIMHAQMQGEDQNDNEDIASSTMRDHIEARMEMHMGTSSWNRPTTTPDGRPLPGRHNMGTTTNPGRGRGDDRGEHMASSTMMGSTTASTTMHMPGFIKHIFSFFAGRKDNASTSTSTLQRPHDDDNSSTTASTTVEAGAEQHGPALPILQFFQHFFDFLGH